MHLPNQIQAELVYIEALALLGVQYPVAGVDMYVAAKIPSSSYTPSRTTQPNPAPWFKARRSQ